MSQPIENYFEYRMAKLGITPDLNQVHLLQYDATQQKNVLKPEPVFRKHEKGIEIVVYTLDRMQPTYTGESSRWKKNWSIIRLENPIVKPNGDTIKYLMPKGQGSHPFFPPQLIDKFEKKEKIVSLFLTEGYFKAFKGAMHGIDIIGLASITHLKDKETGHLHPDILKLIDYCQVQRVVWLTDGDALDVSSKALDPKQEVDLYKRPAQFYSSISTFKQLLDDKDVEKYFAHIDTDAILEHFNLQSGSRYQVSGISGMEQSAADASHLTPDTSNLKPNILRDEVKGLDDIMVRFPDHIPEIVKDINTVSTGGLWFKKFKITIGMSKVRDHFRLHDVNAFILFHQERNPALRDRQFIFNGTRYMYNAEKGSCDIMIPGEAALYFRVGDDYFKWVQQPNQYKQLERQFHPRSKTTITDDHGKPFIKYIPKYEAFCNVPDHANFQLIHHNCFNVYCEIEHKPDEEECRPEDFPAIYGFIDHIFGGGTSTLVMNDNKEKKIFNTLDLGLDYLQLLYQKPQNKLPILCLVSRENNTGKSTFANFLRIMLSANVAIVGNADLAGDFNAHWATKSVVVCDETKIDKQHVIEKIKALSTARKIYMNAKGRGQVELDCFIKFVLITNNEENFIYASDDDIRYWVIKVPVLKTDNPHIVDQFVQEMPAFLSFLSRRKLSTDDKSRMWFHPSLLKTEALKKVIAHSMPTIQKELLNFIREKFFDFGVEEFMMTRQAIHKDCFNNRFEANYLEQVLKDKLKVDLYHDFHPTDKDMFGAPVKQYKTHRHTYPRWESISTAPGSPPEMVRVDVKSHGRPYVFKRSQFINANEMVHISDENKYINDMTPTAIPPPASKELPF